MTVEQAKRWLPLPLYVLRELLIGLGALGSRVLNALLFRGSMHQSISARAYIEGTDTSDSPADPVWTRRRDRIDRWLGPVERGIASLVGAEVSPLPHCHAAWVDEVERAEKTLRRNQALPMNGRTSAGSQGEADGR